MLQVRVPYILIFLVSELCLIFILYLFETDIDCKQLFYQNLRNKKISSPSSLNKNVQFFF